MEEKHKNHTQQMLSPLFSKLSLNFCNVEMSSNGKTKKKWTLDGAYMYISKP
jgi:hypothetical protein